MKIKLEVLYNVAHVQTREFIRPIMDKLISSRGNRGQASMETAHKKQPSFLVSFLLHKIKLEKKILLSNHKKPVRIFCYGKKQ
jgi:hypothetical protein